MVFEGSAGESGIKLPVITNPQWKVEKYKVRRGPDLPALHSSEVLCGGWGCQRSCHVVSGSVFTIPIQGEWRCGHLFGRNIPQCRGRPPETKVYLVQDLTTVRILLCGSPGSAKPRMSSQCYGDIRKMQGFRHLSCETREKSAITFLPCFPLGTIIPEHGLLVNVAVFCHIPSRVQIKAFVVIIGRGIFFNVTLW